MTSLLLASFVEFFVGGETAPEVFGWQHLTYLAIAIVLGALSIVLIKIFCKTEKSLAIAMKVYAAVLLALIVWNRILVAMRDGKAINVIPSTFCGITSLVFGIVGLFAKKDAGIWHYIVYCGFLGGLLTMIYPDFLGQSNTIFFPLTISGLLHHTVAFFYAILLFVVGYIKPSFKRWAYLPLGLCVMVVFGQFEISVGLYGEAMYLTKPVLEGTFLTWYVVGAMFLALHFLFILAWELIQKHKKMTKNQKTQNSA